MSDRLAVLIDQYLRPDDDNDEFDWVSDEAAFCADAIRAAVAADPSIVGMELSYLSEGIPGDDGFASSSTPLYRVAPSEREAARWAAMSREERIAEGDALAAHEDGES